VRIDACKQKHFQHLFRDCTMNNLMFDPSGMYPQGFHPTQQDKRPDFKGNAKRYSRTKRPPRYHLIDFGLSRCYDSRDVVDEPLRGGDRTAPEHQDGMWCNPFHTDIYYLGNIVKDEFIRVRLTDVTFALLMTYVIRIMRALSSWMSWLMK
jgi:hypothetical protein